MTKKNKNQKRVGFKSKERWVGKRKNDDDRTKDIEMNTKE